MKPKKQYGQHFLTDDRIAHQIANSFQYSGPSKNVLEVGPGKGMLTKHLKIQDYKLKCVELDLDMIEILEKTYPDLINNIISEDILRVNMDEAFDGEEFLLIGNYPYNISSQILFKMVDYREYIPEMVGMFQKEVAQRVVAKSGSKTYGVISVLIQAYYDGDYLFDVDADAFYPPPKVTSGVIRLRRKDNFKLDCNEKLFKTVVKTSFSQRRKMLRNTLKGLIKDPDILSQELFKKRPEHLDLEHFISITKMIEESQKN